MSTQAQVLDINDANIGNGFILIQTNELQLINHYDHIIHTINLTEYETNIQLIEKSMNKFLFNSSTLYFYLHQLKNEYYTLIPHTRTKRGLLNIVGEGLKFLFGTMSQEDKKEIEEYLQINKENNKNLINQSNKQITINTKFNEQISLMMETVNKNQLENIMNKVNAIYNDLTYFKYETILKENIHYLIGNIHKIKEIIMSSRLGILSKDILTFDEMENHNINLNNLKDLQLKVATYGKLLLLIIDIPRLNQTIYKEVLIEPIPNHNNNLQIVTNINHVITTRNKVYFPTTEKSKLQLINDTCIQNIFNEHMEGTL